MTQPQYKDRFIISFKWGSSITWVEVFEDFKVKCFDTVFIPSTRYHLLEEFEEDASDQAINKFIEVNYANK